MRIRGYNSIGVWLALPLALSLWQNSSCRNGNSNAGDSIMNAKSNNASQQDDLRGQWGGEHISMEVTDDGAKLEYDCAHGRISEKIVPDSHGNFEAKGFHARERGGPVRPDENNEQPALYRGSIKEKTMTLTVELSPDNEAVGTFTLTHGSAGRVRKCL